MRYKVTTAATFDALTLKQAREQVKEPSNITAEDDLIKEFIIEAGKFVALKSNQVIGTTTFKGTLDFWPTDGLITINRNPVTSVTSVKYYNSDNTLTALVEGTDYFLDEVGEDTTSQPFRIWMKERPSLYERINAIEIVFVAGYLSQKTVHPGIKQAVRLLLTDAKENRTDYVMSRVVSLLPRSVQDIINTFRSDEF